MSLGTHPSRHGWRHCGVDSQFTTRRRLPLLLAYAPPGAKTDALLPVDLRPSTQSGSLQNSSVAHQLSKSCGVRPILSSLQTVDRKLSIVFIAE